jgi:hypothetical protein
MFKGFFMCILKGMVIILLSNMYKVAIIRYIDNSILNVVVIMLKVTFCSVI